MLNSLPPIFVVFFKSQTSFLQIFAYSNFFEMLDPFPLGCKILANLACSTSLFIWEFLF